jgi:tetratricopeptide (TPR) repeat protein/energy-coupling factor transporter ATP-binding protein EcfA2
MTTTALTDVESLKAHFTDREAALAAYDRLWSADGEPTLVLSGMSGLGKSTLLRYLAQVHERNAISVVVEASDARDGHRLLDRIVNQLARHGDFGPYRAAAQRMLDQRNIIAAGSGPEIRQQIGADKKSQVSSVVQSVVNNFAGYAEEQAKRLAEHDRTARESLTSELFSCARHLGKNWVVLVDSYDATTETDTLFDGWFWSDFEPSFGRESRLVVGGRERPARARGAGETLSDWSEPDSNEYLAGWGLTDASLQAAIFRHCTGHPMLTSFAVEVWQQGLSSNLPLFADDLREQTDDRAATQWLFKAFQDRLPPELVHAVAMVPHLRSIDGDTVRAVLQPGSKFADVDTARLLGMSFVRTTHTGEHVAHDLVREVMQSFVRKNNSGEFRRIHEAALAHCLAKDDVFGAIYHVLAADPSGGFQTWRATFEEARFRCNLEAQRQLLSVARLPERWLTLDRPDRGAVHLSRGLLAQYADDLAGCERALRAALDETRGNDRLGEANTLMALGDLFVRTARLGEAGESYGQALELFRLVDDRLGEANTLQSFGRLHSASGDALAAENAFEDALALYRGVGDEYSIASTLVYRGQHRISVKDGAGFADWGTAIGSAIRIEPNLARQVISMTAGPVRQLCVGGNHDVFLAEGLPGLTQPLTAEVGDLDEDQAGTIELLAATFSTIGAIAAWNVVSPDERDQLGEFARANSVAIDEASGGAFALVELADSRGVPKHDK